MTNPHKMNRKTGTFSIVYAGIPNDFICCSGIEGSRKTMVKLILEQSVVILEGSGSGMKVCSCLTVWIMTLFNVRI